LTAPTAAQVLACRTSREAYLKIGRLHPRRCVFHSGCDLFNHCHPSSPLAGKTKNLCPLAEVDRLVKALSFTCTFRRAAHHPWTGEAGRNLFNRYGPNRSRCNGIDRRWDIEAGHRRAAIQTVSTQIAEDPNVCPGIRTLATRC